MPTARTTILNSLGLHARPAMAFVDMANAYASAVSVRRTDGDEVVDGMCFMQLMLGAATQVTELAFGAEGPDAAEAVAALVKLVESRFDEE